MASAGPAGNGRPVYVVEFRFSRDVKGCIDNLTKSMATRLGLGRVERMVSRMTVAGPMETKNPGLLAHVVSDIARNGSAGMRFDGFGTFRPGVAFCNVVASEGFRRMRADVKKRAGSFCAFREEWYGERKPYALLDVGSVGNGFDRALSFLGKWGGPGGMMLDLVISWNGREWRRYPVGFEGVKRRRPAVLRIGGAGHVTSDAHFGHEKVICHDRRPFRSVDEMDRVMRKKWNRAVSNGDDVVFRGDMTRGNDAKNEDYWLSRLNGRVHFLRGNHDDGVIKNAHVLEDPCMLEHDGMRFLLTHVPYRPSWWDGWIMHGHLHTRDVKRHPGINRANKTVNVGMDLWRYAPVSLAELSAKIRA